MPVTWDELPEVDPDQFDLRTVPELLARRGDPHAELDAHTGGLEEVLGWAEKDTAEGLGDLPYPPDYPKMPGEPKRVQPSRARKEP
jgi:hypothetical protein